jgi:hypothetical protein
MNHGSLLYPGRYIRGPRLRWRRGWTQPVKFSDGSAVAGRLLRPRSPGDLTPAQADGNGQCLEVGRLGRVPHPGESCQQRFQPDIARRTCGQEVWAKNTPYDLVQDGLGFAARKASPVGSTVHSLREAVAREAA